MCFLLVFRGNCDSRLLRKNNAPVHTTVDILCTRIIVGWVEYVYEAAVVRDSCSECC